MGLRIGSTAQKMKSSLMENFIFCVVFLDSGKMLCNEMQYKNISKTKTKKKEQALPNSSDSVTSVRSASRKISQVTKIKTGWDLWNAKFLA